MRRRRKFDVSEVFTHILVSPAEQASRVDVDQGLLLSRFLGIMDEEIQCLEGVIDYHLVAVR